MIAVPAAAAGGTTVSGRILDAQGGLTVPNATVELERNGTPVATARTDAGGNFRILDQPPGT
ncbi:MAG: carboxypeptidase regulatory-like domain-containing protein, partial [Candidatus Cybelea sp.]